MKSVAYTEEETSVLVKNVQNYMPVSELIKILERSPRSIVRKVRILFLEGKLEKQVMGFYHNEFFLRNKERKSLFFNSEKLKDNNAKKLRCEFGKRLGDLIYSNEIDQKDLAELLLVTKQAVSCWIKGDYLPKKENGEEIVRLFGNDAKIIFDEFFKKY